MSITAAEVATNPTPNDLVEIGWLPYGDESFLVTVGRDEALVDQLIAGAQEDFMRRMVPKDSREGDGRFWSRETFEKWYLKGRHLAGFRDAEGDRAGIVWHGESPLDKELASLHKKSAETGIDLNLVFTTPDGQPPKGCNDTFAIRVFEKHRDKQKPAGEAVSLARRFMGIAQSLFVNDRAKAEKPVDGIWLETNRYEYDPQTGEQRENGALFLYEKAGYERVGTYNNPDPKNQEERVIMVTYPAQQRTAALGSAALQTQPV